MATTSVAKCDRSARISWRTRSIRVILSDVNARRTKNLLLRQLETSWSLARLHLAELPDSEALWEPAAAGPRVHPVDGEWTADWPDDESYAAGVPTIAWLQWHIGMWWSLAWDRAFGAGDLDHETIRWPGSTNAASDWLEGLHVAWSASIEELSDKHLGEVPATWPLHDGTLGDVAAWVNVELMKNAAEIGFLRFLFASRS